MYIPFEAVTITPLKHNRKILSRFSLQNQMFCVCRLPAVYIGGNILKQVTMSQKKHLPSIHEIALY